jgi:hypothetical protein
MRVTLAPVSGSGGATIGGTTVVSGAQGRLATAAVHADATFEITGLAPGAYRAQMFLPASSTGAASGLWLRSAVVDNVDLLDIPLHVMPGGPDLSGAVFTVTDDHSELSGTLQSASGQPAPDYFVVVLAADRRFWTPDSRRVKSTRPGTDGRFSFADLPAGTYLLAALTDIEPDEWRKAEFLEQLVPASVRVTLADGEKKFQDLRIR